MVLRKFLNPEDIINHSFAKLCYSAPESHLRALFNQFGVVQTCIVNVDKRHAFIKMINRRDAMNAREGMETYKSGDMQLRVSFVSGLDDFGILIALIDTLGSWFWTSRLQ